MAGGCNGCVGGEIGMITPLHDGGWMIIFNSHQADVGLGQAACRGYYNQDIGLAFVTTDKQFSSLKWLTTTNGNETDPGLARYGAFCGKTTDPCSAAGQTGQTFLVGWKLGKTMYLGMMDNTGKMKEGPYNATVATINGVSTNVSWGARDDTWRTLNDGSVVWLDVPNEKSNELRIFTMKYGDDPEPSIHSSSQPVPGPSTHSSSQPGPNASFIPVNPSSGFIVNPCFAFVVFFLGIFLAFF